MSPDLLSLCNISSLWVYENLTKILKVSPGEKNGNLFEGGNTCFGLTMRLHKQLVELGYEPKLLLGHKKHIKNVHCAISVVDPPLSRSMSSARLDIPPPVSPSGLAGGMHDPPLSRSMSSTRLDIPPPASPLANQQFGLKSGETLAFASAELNELLAEKIPARHVELFLDPGYLIFEPLPIPPLPHAVLQYPSVLSQQITLSKQAGLSGGMPMTNAPANIAIFPLKPNWVKLEREGDNLNLYTGVAGENAKFRFYFPLKGVSQSEFNDAWEASYKGESMKHLVFNKLDKNTFTQYYYQNGKLLIRTPNGATRQEIAPENRIETISEIYGISKDLLDCEILFSK